MVLFSDVLGSKVHVPFDENWMLLICFCFNSGIPFKNFLRVIGFIVIWIFGIRLWGKMNLTAIAIPWLLVLVSVIDSGLQVHWTLQDIPEVKVMQCSCRPKLMLEVCVPLFLWLVYAWDCPRRKPPRLVFWIDCIKLRMIFFLHLLGKCLNLSPCKISFSLSYSGRYTWGKNIFKKSPFLSPVAWIEELLNW